MRNLYRTSAALLSAGNVDLLTGNSTHFNVIENRGNYEGALFLARIDHNDSFQVFSGSGNHTEYEKFQKDMRPIAHHDQTLRPRPTMTIVETGPCTFETLRKFFLFINNEKRTRRTKVPFAVFK